MALPSLQGAECHEDHCQFTPYNWGPLYLILVGSYTNRYNVLKHIYTDPCRNLLDLHIPEHVWNYSLFRRPQFCS